MRAALYPILFGIPQNVELREDGTYEKREDGTYELREPGAPLNFDFYVDSVTGNDGNSGLSPAVPFKTLTAVASVLASGKRIALRCGSVFTTSINHAEYDDVTIGAYGAGARPIINCADTLSGWTIDGGKALTYKINASIVLVGTGVVYVTLQEDDVLLQRVTSSALAEAQAGSFYVTSDEGTVDFYVHPSDGGNPNSNGKVYSYASRDVGIRLGARAHVSGIEAKNQRGNNGSFDLGAFSDLTNCIARNGHKHNALVGHGSTVSLCSFLEGHKHDDPGIMLVIYSPGAVASPAPDTYVENNTFTCRGLRATPVNCTYAHTSGADGSRNIYIRYNTFVDCFGSLNGGASNISGDLYFDDNYISLSSFTTMPYQLGNPYIYGGKYARRNKAWFPEPWASTFTVTPVFFLGTKTVEFDDNILNLGPYFTFVIGAPSGVPNITARRNKGSALGQSFIQSQVNNTVVVATDNVFGCGVVYPIDLFSASSNTITSENNSWPGAAAFRNGGNSYTWAQWQALGHDLNSNIGGDNRTISLPSGSSLAGTLADWPNIWLWINAQTTSSITQSGGNVSAVADLSRPGRNLVLHEPSPGNDRVTLSTLGGKPWFTSVLDGGLKYPSQDYPAPIEFIAVVVRLDAILSPASAVQYVFCTHSVPFADVGMALGDTGGTFTNEVVSCIQGGGSGWGYTNASFSKPATTPLLIVVYYDATAGVPKLRINGVATGSFTNSNSITPHPVYGNKGEALMILRGLFATNRLQGGLGELLLAGPASFDFITAAETEMMSRWGIT